MDFILSLIANWYKVLIWVSVLTALFSPFVFLGGFYAALLGMVLWSIGLGAHESLMRAIVANMIPSEKRASAYGIFNGGYGAFWFVGSLLIGFLYDASIPAVIMFSCTLQFLAIPLLVWVNKRLYLSGNPRT